MGGAYRPTEKVAIKFAIIIHITKHLPRYRHKKHPTDAAMDCRSGVSNTPLQALETSTGGAKPKRCPAHYGRSIALVLRLQFRCPSSGTEAM